MLETNSENISDQEIVLICEGAPGGKITSANS
jgi:hypothetical protein